MPRKKTRNFDAIPDGVIYQLVHEFLTNEESADSLTERANRDATIQQQLEGSGWAGKFQRFDMYPLVRHAIKRRLIVFNPPLDARLLQQVTERFHYEESRANRIRVVDTHEQVSIESVASAAAELIVELIQGFVERGKKTIGLGLGAGTTTRQLAREISRRLRMAKVIPGVRIHALTSAFDVTNWERAPSAFVNYFSQTGLLVDFIGLYCPAVVASSEYQHVKQEVGVKKAFALAEEIDIVVTSLGTDDPNNSELVHCLGEFDKQNKTDVLNELKELEFRGDVLYQPFSDTRPIQDLAAVPVTLFDIEKLCEWSERSDKHVVLVAGSTTDGKSKAKALVPLLSQRSLRIWDHLVLDTRTAQGVCSECSGE